EPGAAAGEEQESRSRDLRGPLEIEQLEPGGDLPVGERLEVEPPRLPPATHHLVLGGVASGRNRSVRQVGDPRGERFALLLELLQLLIETLDAIPDLAHRGDLGLGGIARLLAPRDLLARRVAPRLELLGLVEHGEAALLDLIETLEIRRHALEGHA